MDDKPPIDFDKLKELRDEKEHKTEKPHPSLTDPYYPFRQLINTNDFDEVP